MNVLKALEDYFKVKLEDNWPTIENFGTEAGTEEFEKAVEPLIENFNNQHYSSTIF